MAKKEPEEELEASPKKKGLSSQTKLLIGLFSLFFVLMITTVTIVVLMLRPAPVVAVNDKNPADAKKAKAGKSSGEDAKSDSKSESAEAAPEGASAEKPADSGESKAEAPAEKAEGGGEEGAKDTTKDGAAVYYTIKPVFIVNFQYKGRMRFLQVAVDIMAHSDKVINAVDKNLPLIKNNLITLFESQDFDALQTPQGREKLRTDSLKVVQKVLEDQIGDTGADQVLFTSFVMQ